jgi:hypothetical protein
VKEVPFAELRSQPEKFVDETMSLVGKVFFDVNCPPPGGGSALCTLTGYLASEDLEDLGPAEVQQAFPIVEDGQLVSCHDTAGTGACPGWGNGRRYRVVATVKHRVLGGRETDAIELHVQEKAAL